MKLAETKELFSYNRWAAQQMLDAAENLTVEQFVEPDDTPFGSVRNELVHILDAQWGWVDIWSSALQERDRTAVDFDPVDYPDISSVRRLWEEVESATEQFLQRLDDEHLDQIVNAEFDWGGFSASLWAMMVHILTHGTQHRSEVAMKLTNFGHSPGMVDFLFYFVAREGIDQP
jgi:uncharacterized damage-inducible protein DinB